MNLTFKMTILLLSISFSTTSALASIDQSKKEILAELNYLYLDVKAPEMSPPPAPLTPPIFKKITVLGSEKAQQVELSDDSENSLIFDIPVTYNTSVRHWIKYFQTSARSTFRKWLERSARYLPNIQIELSQAGLPQDLGYLAMIESGFSPNAMSSASAVGIWQFMAPTGNHYGLHTSWWLDERRDYYKSTQAAIWYMTDLYKIFGSWYLVAASYNMGEARVKRLIEKYHTNNFWTLADMGLLSDETKNYVPKVLAAMLIAKAPALYGFRDLEYHLPESFEYYHIPGGTDLKQLAAHLGVSSQHLKELNPELIHAFVPRGIKDHLIRIPKGSMLAVSDFIRLKRSSQEN
jgi:membrane-bound lytic murein transglycosylase D